jgi:hypothetical protein
VKCSVITGDAAIVVVVLVGDPEPHEARATPEATRTPSTTSRPCAARMK